MDAQKKKDQNEFSRRIGQKQQLKLNALKKNQRSVWLGLGTLGMVGWSVTIPALLGTAAGVWLDKKYAQSFSWTLTLLMTGLLSGCLIAWNWVGKEHKKITENNKNDNE